MKHVVVLSPHLDDGVFSCGAMLAACRRTGRRADVVTVFAGRPPVGELPPIAHTVHANMGNPADPIGARRAEDLAAVAVVGASAIHLDHPEAAYRMAAQPILRRSGRLPEDMPPEERALLETLRGEITSRYATPEAVELFAPLGIGGHVDHLLVHELGRILFDAGYDVSYFEDFPYALNPAATAAAMQRSSDIERVDRALLEQDLSMRAQAMACYASQLRVVFPGLDHGRDIAPQLLELLAFCATPASGSPSPERYYRRSRRP